jgi:hypothetical protein
VAQNYIWREKTLSRISQIDKYASRAEMMSVKFESLSPFGLRLVNNINLKLGVGSNWNDTYIYVCNFLGAGGHADFLTLHSLSFSLRSGEQMSLCGRRRGRTRTNARAVI